MYLNFILSEAFKSRGIILEDRGGEVFNKSLVFFFGVEFRDFSFYFFFD